MISNESWNFEWKEEHENYFPLQIWSVPSFPLLKDLPARLYINGTSRLELQSFSKILILKS